MRIPKLPMKRATCIAHNTAWGCAFQPGHTKSPVAWELKRKQRPIKGMFTAGKTEAKDKENIAKYGPMCVTHFVPFKRNTEIPN